MAARTRFSLSSPTVAKWFHGYNRNKPRGEQIRPATFGLIAHPDPLTPQLDGAPDRGRPAAPYNLKPASWPRLPWYDRASHNPITITTLTPRDDPEQFTQLIMSGAVRVNTIADILAAIRTRPEHKSLDPSGRPTTGTTRGLLKRRPIETAPVITDLIGKEGNQLEERATGTTDDPAEYRSNYGARTDRFTQLVIPVLQQMGVHEVMKRTGKKKSAVYGVLAGRLKKRGTQRQDTEQPQSTTPLNDFDRLVSECRCTHTERCLPGSGGDKTEPAPAMRMPTIRVMASLSESLALSSERAQRQCSMKMYRRGSS